MPLVLRLLNKHMTFPILLGVKSANTEVPSPQRRGREERAEQFETDIKYIDN